MFIDYLPEYFFYGKDSDINILILDAANKILGVLSNIFGMLLVTFAEAGTNLENGDFLNILGMVGIALLTVMTPIAVAVFNNENKKKYEDDYENLDRSTILEHVVKAKRLLLYMALIYTPILLWGFFPHWFFHVVFLISWACGIWGIVRILRNSYLWMRGDEFQLRYAYLQGLSNSSNLESLGDAWSSFWKIKSIRKEMDFFTLFISTVDNLLGNNIKRTEAISKLIQGFNESIDKRLMHALVTYPKFFPKILEWHFSFWEKENQLIKKHDKLELWGNYSNLSRDISTTFEKIEERSLKERESLRFFRYFKPHIEKYKEHSIQRRQGKEYYIQAIMPVFFHTLVRNMEDDDIRHDHNIWVDFPAEWKITAKNMGKQGNNFSENDIPLALWQQFWHWARDRVVIPKSEYDFVLDEVSKNLFPNVCPMMWARILILSMRSWGSNRMRSLIENPINFGGAGRIRSGWIEDGPEGEKKQRDKEKREESAEEKETIDLALRIGMTEEFLNERIAELEEMKDNYSADSSEEWSRKEYIDLFKRMNARREELRNSANQ